MYMIYTPGFPNISEEVRKIIIDIIDSKAPAVGREYVMWSFPGRYLEDGLPGIVSIVNNPHL